MKTVALIKDKMNAWPVYQKEFEKNGIQVKLFDILKESERLRLFEESFDALVWKAKHDPHIKAFAKRILYLYNVEYGIPTYPLWSDYWHYDDKIAQNFLMQKNGINTPVTHVFYQKNEAFEYIKNAQYPIVYKFPHGAGSANVGLLKNRLQAYYYILRVFNKGVRTYFREEIHRKYVYFQEFLKDNDGDYRIVCYKNGIIKGFFRENRKDAPFASGAGIGKKVDLPESMLEFIFNIHQKLNATIMSYDVMKDEKGNWSLTEFSVIHGGTLFNRFYNDTFNYSFIDGGWNKERSSGDWIEYEIEYLLRDVWKWE